MKTMYSALRSGTLAVGTLSLTLTGSALLASSAQAQAANTRARVNVTPLPLNGASNSTSSTTTAPATSGGTRTRNSTSSATVPATTTPAVTAPIVTTPVITGGGYVVPNNGVIFNPYGNFGAGAVVSNGDVSGYGGAINGNSPGAAFRSQASANTKSSVPTGQLANRPIRVRRVPRQSAGTQRLLNNSNLPIVTGIVQTKPTNGVFTLLVGDERVRIVQARQAPATLSQGDLVQVQGLRRRNVLRAGSISILRDR